MSNTKHSNHPNEYVESHLSDADLRKISLRAFQKLQHQKDEGTARRRVPKPKSFGCHKNSNSLNENVPTLRLLPASHRNWTMCSPKQQDGKRSRKQVPFSPTSCPNLQAPNPYRLWSMLLSPSGKGFSHPWRPPIDGSKFSTTFECHWASAYLNVMAQ